jgi:hypothetical protein
LHLLLIRAKQSRKRRCPWPQRPRCAGAGPTEALAASASNAEWLPEKKPLYTYSLPDIEAWLRSIGFAWFYVTENCCQYKSGSLRQL